MIPVPAEGFLNDQLEAAGRFAQTMIVVDDEADLARVPEPIAGTISRPRRAQSKAAAELVAGPQGVPENEQVARSDITHVLDAKQLMDSSLEHGLVCSILRPGEDEDLRDRIRRAAQRVDIVCLDWEIHGDGGKTTRGLIKDILDYDRQSSGRLRLIVVYTAERARVRILETIKRDLLSSLDRSEKARVKLSVNNGREIRSGIGLRIVCFVKAYDARTPKRLMDDRVSERELPGRILQEFASLSEGLMSNVALGTLAAIRDSAHQIVGSFSSKIDGPYFHHRAIVPNPDEAEDYAIAVVLDALRNAVRLQEVGRRFAGRSAIERRLRYLASNDETLRLSFKRGQNDPEESLDFHVDHVVRLVNDGASKQVYGQINVNGKPKLVQAKRSITSFFAGTLSDSHEVMRRFAVVTGISSHPGTHDVSSGDYTPSLGLGSIVVDKRERYWLCIQASCDSLRITESRPFLFVPLEEVDGQTRHIVPRFKGGVEEHHVALRLEKRAYSKSKSILFAPTPRAERVLARYGGRPKRLRFVSEGREVFDWIADLKHYPALSVAQEVGQEMGRLGYDEFEPFRSGEG